MAAGYAIWLGLCPGAGRSLRRAPFVGRGSAIGIAGALTFAGFILNGYQTRSPRWLRSRT